jgi:SpoVK/Ycf46/Vps4 family AAA+-type ATPase
MTPDQDLDQRGRIILWHGHPGTGKTSAIRALMREWSPWCQSELLMDPEMVFDDPNYLHEVIIRPAKSKLGESGPRYRLLVAEDADRYLQAGTHLRNNPALDRLLNVADGILGQGSNVIVLLTTNSNIAALHPALTRPGRCLAITEFERFDQAAARKWLGTLASAPSGASTLAELFELVRGTGRLGGLDEVRLGQYL